MPASAAGISAVSVEFPSQVRGNEFWIENYPDMVSQEREGEFVRLLASRNRIIDTASAFDAERQAYMNDIFRGARQRRTLPAGETSVDLESRALQKLCRAREISLHDIDAIMVHSMMPDTLGSQNAAHLTARLGLRIPAWNYESTCNSSIVGLQSANALIRAGEYRRIAVITSTASSKLIDPDDSLSWFIGDGAGALLIEDQPEEFGIIATHIIGTPESCGAWRIALESASGEPRLRWRTGDANPGRLMRDNAEKQLTACVNGVLDKTGHELQDIDFFIFPTPLAWFSSFCAKSLGVSHNKTISTYESYTNIGAPLTSANLFHALHEEKIKAGDLVLLFGVGAGSTAGAVLMRCADIRLGEFPD